VSLNSNVMFTPGNISISDFEYSLPTDRIASHPLSKRDESKLLIYRDGEIGSDVFKNIGNYLPEGSRLVLNNTKVVSARIIFLKETGATIEVFLLEPVFPADYSVSFSSHEPVVWKCMVGNQKRWKTDTLERTVPQTDTKLKVRKSKKVSDGFEVEFSWTNTDLCFAQVVELCGEVPIPPYLNRQSEEVDKYRYQTIYAQPEGSVAAPTAGLHFTPEVFSNLKKLGITPDYITLHVGAGTFKPVKADVIINHEMHTEHFLADIDLIKGMSECDNFRVVVGTTTLRTLESLYWLGVKASQNQLCPPYFISQWEPYKTKPILFKAAFYELWRHMEANGLETLMASTQIIIAPGYNVQTADALVTNFHQPRSTLLLLVSAFIGEQWRDVYAYALRNDFRFLSYGDSSLLFRS